MLVSCIASGSHSRRAHLYGRQTGMRRNRTEEIAASCRRRKIWNECGAHKKRDGDDKSRGKIAERLGSYEAWLRSFAILQISRHTSLFKIAKLTYFFSATLYNNNVSFCFWRTNFGFKIFFQKGLTFNSRKRYDYKCNYWHIIINYVVEICRISAAGL